MKNILKCTDGISIEADITDKLQHGYFGAKCPLYTLEDNLLSLASSETIDGVFFCCVIYGSTDDAVPIARFQEFGAFSGFYWSVMHAKLKEKFNENVFPYKTYTSQDVEMESKRSGSLFTSRRKGMYIIMH